MLQSGLVTDEDIDAIIKKGEQETADLNNKLQEYSENAMKFTMDGGAWRFKHSVCGVGIVFEMLGLSMRQSPDQQRARAG